MSTEGQIDRDALIAKSAVGLPALVTPIPDRSDRFSNSEAKDVLLVQEDPDIRAIWATVLRNAGYIPHPLESIEALFEALTDVHPWRAIAVDLGFRGAEGTKFLDRLRAEGRAIPVFLTGWEASVAGSASVKAYPGLSFLLAPFQSPELVSAIRALPPPREIHS